MRLTTAGAGLKVSARWPRRAYAGYPFHVSVASSGVGAGSKVELQVRRGSGWRRFGSVLLGADAGTGPALLGVGRHRVRAIVRIGGESIVSPTRRLTVVRARSWTTSRRQDGAWRQTTRGTVRFRISGGGRIIGDGVFRQSLLCPTPGMISPFTTVVADAVLPRTTDRARRHLRLGREDQGRRDVYPRKDPRRSGQRRGSHVPAHLRRRLEVESPAALT